MFCEQLNFVLRCLSWWTIAFVTFLPSMTQSELFLMKLCKIYPFEWARAPARKRRRMNDELANNLLMNLAWLGTSSSNRRKRRNEWMSGSAKKASLKVISLKIGFIKKTIFDILKDFQQKPVRGSWVGRASFKRSQVGATLLTVRVPTAT